MISCLAATRRILALVGLNVASACIVPPSRRIKMSNSPPPSSYLEFLDLCIAFALQYAADPLTAPDGITDSFAAEIMQIVRTVRSAEHQQCMNMVRILLCRLTIVRYLTLGRPKLCRRRRWADGQSTDARKHPTTPVSAVQPEHQLVFHCQGLAWAYGPDVSAGCIDR